uniref:RING-type domain-containing protein n=1 Tax=Globodera rostochiensis TaxID=31243 RepID=A0A914I373_GLORO
MSQTVNSSTLVSQAKSADPNERLPAVSRICGLLSKSANADKLLIAEFVSIGILPVLVSCLKANDDKLIVEAASAIGNIADGNAREVVEAGAVPLLVKLLQSPNMEVCTYTAKALGNIADGNAREVIEAGAVPHLVNLLHSPNMEVCENTAMAFARIVDDEFNCASNDHVLAVIEAGALPPLIKLTQTPNEDVCTHASFAIECIIVQIPNLYGYCLEVELMQSNGESVIQLLKEFGGLQKIEQLKTNESEVVLKMIEMLQSSNGCVVCFHKKIEIAFIPCWHACVCEVCADKIGTCPMCHQIINDKKRIYLP